MIEPIEITPEDPNEYDLVTMEGNDFIIDVETDEYVTGMSDYTEHGFTIFKESHTGGAGGK